MFLVLYRGLYRNALHIRPFLWIKSINPSLTSFFNDPWYFECPLALKPTYVNMDIDHANLHISDLLTDNTWNINLLYTIFGPFLNDNILS